MTKPDVAQGYLNAAMEALKRANHELGGNVLCIKLIHDLEDLMNPQAREELLHVGSLTVLRNFVKWFNDTAQGHIEPFNAKGSFDRDQAIDELILEFVREFGR
ncbi:hypothetical protein HWB51_gp094 [Mycobacterium phage Cuke]|uniref:Uncharacterized protein n=1 Tax=Mycobacterium phage Cuke TaxID=2079417 RepID=A0A2L1IX21_9CAUD|nr:hypothetical protein HWB51_gp094 [Mycobacterium phage Cuke]AVD99718.1 hypothetical protein SEA_CUKE_102 [Mycobacterium phage Cuke]